MDDITVATPADGELDLASDWLNSNLRDALYLILSPPTCILTKTNTQTITGTGGSGAESAWTTISWNNKVADTEDPDTPMYDSGSPTKISIATPGWYEFDADICMVIDNSGNNFSVAFQVNGDSAQIYAGDSVEWSTGGGGVNHATSFCTLISLDEGDYVEVLVRMSRTSNLTSTNNWNLPRVAARRVRGLDASIPTPSGPFINDFTLHTATIDEPAIAGKYYIVDCSKGDIRLTLPKSSEANAGDAMIFKRWKGPGDIILVAQGDDTINGVPNAHITDGLHLPQAGQGRVCLLDTTNGGWLTW